MIVNRVTHPSLHENFQCQISFAKAKLRVQYPPPYKHHIWNYAKANANGINKAISQFNWQGFFTNQPFQLDINKYFFSNFIPNKKGIFSDLNPPCFGKKVKDNIELKNRVCKEYIRNDRPEDLYYLLQNLTNEVYSYISKCKNDYFIPLGKKLCDPYEEHYGM